MREQGIQNLVDFMVEDIMTMTDEEILAEATPEELADAQRWHREALDKAIASAFFGGSVNKTRQTALRLRGRSIETVELDDAGNIIEPIRCTCGGMAVIHGPKCPFYCLTT